MWRSGGNEAEVRIQPNVLCVSLAPLLHIVEGHGHPASSDGMLVSPPSLGVAEQNACYLCSERRGVSLRAPGLGKAPRCPPPSPIPCGCSGGEGAVKAAMGGRKRA